MKYTFLFGLFKVFITVLVSDSTKPENNQYRVDSCVWTDTGSEVEAAFFGRAPDFMDHLETYIDAILPALMNERPIPLEFNALIPPDYFYRTHAEREAAKIDDSEDFRPVRGFRRDEIADGEIGLILASHGIRF